MTGISRHLIAAATLAVFSAVFPAPPAHSAEGGVEVLVPGDGAVLGEAQVRLAGTYRSDRYGTVNVTVNGKEMPPLAVKNGVFTTLLSLVPGENRVSLKAPGSSAEVTYRHDPAAKKGLFRFHAGYAEGECGECHQGGPGVTVFRQHDTLCYSCHDRKDEAPFLHGPVGAGQCTFCHDPHGSPEPYFLTKGQEGLCEGCHDQTSSGAHLKKMGDRPCVECHDPHGGEKKYFLH